MRSILIVLAIVLLILTNCQGEQPTIIIITSTPVSIANSGNMSIADTPIPTQTITPLPQPTIVLSPPPSSPLSNPTPNPTRLPVEIPSQHVIQSGETLSIVAGRYNLSVSSIIELNNLQNPDILSIGQVLQLPEVASGLTPNFKIIPDSRLVNSPDSIGFDIAAFIAQQTGFIRTATDTVTTRGANGVGVDESLTAAQVVERVSQEYSVEPRVLLLLLEYRAGWLSNPAPPEALQTHPLISEAQSGSIDRSGLYRQLAWAANELNRGYYGWKYRGNVAMQFDENNRFFYNPELNAGTIALQRFLAMTTGSLIGWQNDVHFNGFYSLYARYFGNPFQNTTEPLVPPNLQQPELILPFEPGVEWRFTGGPHGGWGSGSAWASLDFAPTYRDWTVACYEADAWVTAAASGIIARVDDGSIILDLDNDGDERTGWTINYLHTTARSDLQAGQFVNVGDRLGNPSCEGGFSTATHLHIGRRYNGEWIPADCDECLQTINIPPFEMGGWVADGFEGQEYQGLLRKEGQTVTAEQGVNTTINIITR